MLYYSQSLFMFMKLKTESLRMQSLLKQISKILLIGGVILSFLAILEVIRAYQTMRDFHPWAGIGFLIVILFLMAYLIWQLRLIMTLPAPPVKPEPGPEDIISKDCVNQHKKYYLQIQSRLEANEEVRLIFNEHLLALGESINRLPQNQTSPVQFRSELTIIEEELLAPIIKYLDREAEKIVGDNVGLVTIGTALSPYRSIDLYIVLARNLRMINSIIKLYRTRPTYRETLSVFYDVAL